MLDDKIFFESIVNNFKSRTIGNEDDVKLNFYSEIVKPILTKLGLQDISFNSEKGFINGGRADATFQNISFEYKDYNLFRNLNGINEAIYGRSNSKDRGLIHYLVANASISNDESLEIIEKKLYKSYGVAFDGKTFVFARYVKVPELKKMDFSKTVLDGKSYELPLEFKYETVELKHGVKKLALLFSQQNKIALTKNNLLGLVNPKTQYVQGSIKGLYEMLVDTIVPNFDNNGNLQMSFSERARTLYLDWDRVFGTIYGDESEETDFTNVSSVIKGVYSLPEDYEVDTKMYLFSLQTFFNIFLKLLVNSFLSQLINPTFVLKSNMTKNQIIKLFDGEDIEQNIFVRNFFETHYLEWFTYTMGQDTFDVKVVNDTLAIISKLDLSTFVLKPESMQDILQEIYMNLIPSKLRHIMGEYFSPDWVVEHVLNNVGYKGNDISKKLIDPTCGSGSFITHALKRVVSNRDGKLSWDEVIQISNNIVGFDINPISVVAAKANFILTVFSAYFSSSYDYHIKPIDVPIYIADSVLSPVVYSQQKKKTVITSTIVGDFELPKFKDINTSNSFLRLLSEQIHEKASFDIFWNLAYSENLVEEDMHEVTYQLFNRLCELHRSGKDSFWPIILKNSFASVMINDKFDYVVGNPPWISWKSMSKKYREGTLTVWQSYGIFEKSAYDKKTTHDDFGMAVTYVAIDLYLKEDGIMCFLLPASFLKSTKGGEGFRKFKIVRNNQNIDFKIEKVDDFTGVNLFTIPTVAIVFNKTEKMTYPMSNYYLWNQIGKRSKIDPHVSWSQLSNSLEYKVLTAKPVSESDSQSAWLTLENIDFASKVLSGSNRFYRGRKGIEPAGAKGVYILKDLKPSREGGYIAFVNDMSRQRRKDLLEVGEIPGVIESEFIYPMLGGRNIQRWRIVSNEYILMPHDIENLYGIQEAILAERAPRTYRWLNKFKDGLLASRIQNGKFFNKDTQPFYRLDNVGPYTFSEAKVLWKEQTKSMAAVVVETFDKTINIDRNIKLFENDKPIVVDSKVLMLDCRNVDEAYYVAGVLNSPSIRDVIDGYAINTNRGIDVLKYINLPEFDENNSIHVSISMKSKLIHEFMRSYNPNIGILATHEDALDELVLRLFV